MSFRPSRDKTASLTLAAWSAFLVALAAALVHTYFAYLYFRPSLDDLLESFLPWGPLLVPEWIRHTGRLFAAALFFLSLPGLGKRTVALIPHPRLPSTSLRVTIVVSLSNHPLKREGATALAHIGVALVVWSTLGLALAAAGLSNATALRIVSVVLAAWGLWEGKDILRRSLWTRSPSPQPSPLKGEGKTLIDGVDVGLFVFAGLVGLTTVVPETFYDALVYHLAVPQAYLQAGRLVDLADIHLSRLPGLVQTLYLWGLAWSDERLCKLLNLGFGLLLCGAMADWVGKRWSRAAGHWAALLYLSSPMIIVNLWSCTNDILCGFFFFLSFTAWVDAWAGEDKPVAFRLGLAGFFFGAAAAAKYTALFGAPFFIVDFVLRMRRPLPHPLPQAGEGSATSRRRWQMAKVGGAFALGALLPLLPWWIRTGIWTGNPFFPEAAGLLGGDMPENIALLAGWDAEAGGAGNYFQRALSLARESLRGVEGGRFGFVGPALLMLLPLALFTPMRGNVRPLLLCSVLSYAAFAVPTGRLRYFIPQLSLLFVLAAVFLTDYEGTIAGNKREPSAVRRLALALRLDPARWLKRLLAAVVMLNGLWIVLVFQRFNQGWDVAWGRTSPSEYLRREHVGVYGHPSQGAFDFLADRQAGGKVFVIGEARTYRCPLPARAGASFNVPPYALWLRADPAPGAFVERLRREGYSYLLLNAPEWRRLTPPPYKEDAYARPLGAALDSLAPPVYRDPWTVVFEVPK